MSHAERMWRADALTGTSGCWVAISRLMRSLVGQVVLSSGGGEGAAGDETVTEFGG